MGASVRPAPRVAPRAPGAKRRLVVVVGSPLPPSVARRLTGAGFALRTVGSSDARATLEERLPAALVVVAADSPDWLALVRWAREQERLAFVQIFVVAPEIGGWRALREGADGVFASIDDDAAREVEARVERAEGLERLALFDPLTALRNRRFLDDRLRSEAAHATRTRGVFTFAIVDLDDFKAVNDRFGHAVGDRALIAFASALRSHLRAYDVPCRYGGDEFVILFPNTGMAAARAALSNIPSRGEWCVPGVPPVTFSVGLSVFPKDGDSWPQLFDAADRALLRAKRLRTHAHASALR